MSEAIKARRRRDTAKDWLATVLTAAVLALLLAALVEGLLALAGLLAGDPTWLRNGLDRRLAAGIAWLEPRAATAWLITLLQGFKDWLADDSLWHDVTALAVAFYSPVLLVAKRIGPTLIARYDDEALRAMPVAGQGLCWAGPLGEHQEAAWQRLRAWCFAGTGTGASPLWQPWVMPAVEERFSVAILTGVNGVGKSHLAEALGQELDGSPRLAACAGRLDGWKLRLHVKAQNCMWWRQRRPDDPWDTGYLVEDPAARKRLAHFLPRRATFMVADELRPESLLECIAELGARRADFRHPVRLLFIDVALPGSLELVWDAASGRWATEVQELGVVPVIDLSHVRFDVPQFRALVGAQPGTTAGEQLHLLGRDEEWAPLVEALDREPVLLAETIRHVREDGVDFAALLRDTDVAERMEERQGRRTTPRLPPDLYGRQRDVLRERVLGGRAEHRERAVRAALQDAGESGEELYHALLIAGVANGVSLARLRQRLDWKTDRFGTELLDAVFGPTRARGWVPALKPAVILDEMLRRHFDAPRGAALSEETRERVAELLRSAWLANPGGTMRTVSRWAARQRRDDFAACLLQPSGLHDLHDDASSQTRVDIARALFELAVLHEGDVAAAEAALQALRDEEVAVFETSIAALLTHPTVRGLPALVLWLRLLHRRWARVGGLPADRTTSMATGWLVQAERLARQTRLFHTPSEPLQEAFLGALDAVLPHLAGLALPAASDAGFRQAAATLDRRLVISGEPLKGVHRRVCGMLAARFAAQGHAVSGEPAAWATAILAQMESMVLVGNAAAAGIGLPDETAGVDPSLDEGRSWGMARSLALVAYALADRDAAATQRTAERGARIAEGFPGHEGIQLENAKAWCYLAWACEDSDAAATTHAAERVAQIAAGFPGHEGIQFENARAWCYVAWAHKDSDAAATAGAAERVAQIAARFPQDEGIQFESAVAWRLLAWTHMNSDATATRQAAECVARIAASFPGHEGIQFESAVAWRFLAGAHCDSDPAATEEAVERVAQIAAGFPRDERIQHEGAQAWRALAWGHHKSDAATTGRAADRLARIAAGFPGHEGIQYESAHAWTVLAGAHEHSDAAATTRAAERVAWIAAHFPGHPGIQFECAQAWRKVGWAHKDSDAAATERAAERVARVAAGFPGHEGIQRESALAWCNLAWAHRNSDAAATERAAKRVAQIAAGFPGHERIQFEGAQAWRILAWTHKATDAVTTEHAAERVAQIAARFPGHEGIQHESVQAWCSLAQAHKDSDAAASRRAAECAGQIAAGFPEHEDMQHQSAIAWRFFVEAAVKFDDPTAVAGGMLALDALAGVYQQSRALPVWSGHKAFGTVLQERAAAQATVARWHESRGS